MIFLLKVSGVFSSLILLASGFQIASTNIDVNLIPKEQIWQENLLNYIGTALIGLGCFTGPLLFGMANLINKREVVHLKINDE